MPGQIEEYFVEGLRNSLNKLESINSQMEAYLNSMTNKMLFHIEDVSHSNRTNINKYKLEEYLEIEFKKQIIKMFNKKLSEIAENLINECNNLKNKVINSTNKEMILEANRRNEDIHAELRISSRINLTDNLDLLKSLRYSNFVPEEILYEIKPFINRMVEKIEQEINESFASVIKSNYFRCDECISERKKIMIEDENIELLEEKEVVPLSKVIDINGDKKELIMKDGSIITIDEFNKKIIPLVDENNMIMVTGIGPMNVYDYLNEIIIPLDKLQNINQETEKEKKDLRSSFR